MIKRDVYLKRILPFVEKDVIKVLTGIRRSGKSVMLTLIQDELLFRGVHASQIIKFNFESFINAPFCTAMALYQEISRRIQGIEGKTYLFLDEIQEVQDWEKCINSIRCDFDCDIYITGSNAHLLSGELATYLGGRYVEFVIYPFSFEEFFMARQQMTPQITSADCFKNYIKIGGMPFLSTFAQDMEAMTQYLNDIYHSIVLKDIVKRNNIRDIDLLEKLVTYIMANNGHVFSARSISAFFKSEKRTVSTETILNYLSACQEAFLFYKVSREDMAGKKVLTVNEKYYIADHGMREAIYGRNTEDIDQILENIVYIELKRRGYAVTIGKVGDLEIDFIAKKNNDKLYIQVAYLLASEQTIQREFGVYNAISDHYPKYVISMDELDMSRNGIRHRNIRDFLLDMTW